MDLSDHLDIPQITDQSIAPLITYLDVFDANAFPDVLLHKLLVGQPADPVHDVAKQLVAKERGGGGPIRSD